MVAALAFFALVPFVLVWTQMQSTHHEEKEPVFQQSDLLGRGEFGLRKLRKEYIRVFGKQAHAVHGGGRRTPGEPGEVVVLESAMDVYVAGIPRQPRVIARDLLMAALIRDSSDDLQRALLFCVETQGTAFNPLTGEEPGKIAHDYPGVEGSNSLSSKYNSIDSTPLFIIAAFRYFQLSPDWTLKTAIDRHVLSAVGFIRRHLDASNLYFDSPASSKAKGFAVKATYWKDAMIAGRTDGAPKYPVVYTLAHVQALAALRFASILLLDPELNPLAGKMLTALKEHLWQEDAGTFAIGKDALGLLPGLSSDALHLLWYLRPDDLDGRWLSRLALAVKPLDTSIGFASIRSGDEAEQAVVWPVDQAFIHAAAVQHPQLKHTASTARRMDTALVAASSMGEFFRVKKDKKVELVGSTITLKTASSALYFSGQRSLSLKTEAEAATTKPQPKKSSLQVASYAAAGSWPLRLSFVDYVHGVAPGDMRYYARVDNNYFQCRDGSQRIPFSALNDDFCDCNDQSDEPGTSACPNSQYYCDGILMPSNRVLDGVRDCPDSGADEMPLVF